MTPKEKANELVDKFSNEVLIDNYEAKRCALIAVDEVIQSYKDSWLQYWKEVKQEIELL